MTEEAISSKPSYTLNSDSLRIKALIRASVIAIGVDLGLILLKYLLSQITGNAVLLADALHSGGDLAISLMVLISILVEYTFQGSSRAKYAEAVVSCCISIFLILGSLQMFVYVWTNDPSSFILVSGVGLVVALAGISVVLAITLKMAKFKKTTGVKYQSVAFSAEGDHTYSDFLSSSGVWITLFLGYFGIHIERLTTALIGLVVLNIGIKLALRSLRLFYPATRFSFRLKKILHADIRHKLGEIRTTLRSFSAKIRFHAGRIVTVPIERSVKQKRLVAAGNVLLIVLLYFGTGFYSIKPYQTGIELLFGKVIKKNPPGLHFYIPQPFGTVIPVDTGIKIRLESGFRTDMSFKGKEPSVYLWEYTHVGSRYTKIPDEAMTIVGDENLVDVNFLCYYRIIDPVQYALDNKDVHETLRSLLNYNVHSVLGHYRLDPLLTSERGKVQQELLAKLKETVERLPLGVEIQKVYMQETHPPIAVVPQYRAVASAREKRDEIVHLANAYANSVVPRSRGEATSIILDAAAYSSEKRFSAKAEAQRFDFKHQIFTRDKKIQEIRLWWKSIENALKEKKIYVLPHAAKRRFYTSEMPKIKQVDK